MDTVDRIFDLVDQQYKEQRDFARAIGVTPSIVSEWRRRKSASFHKRLPQIAATLGTTAEYLLTGQEEPKPRVTDDDIKFALFGGDGEITDAMYEEVKQFAAFVRQREAEKKE